MSAGVSQKTKPARRSQALVAMLFLAPNLLGFLVFTLGPLVVSLFMAFTNWDLRLHNRFKDEGVKFVGLENFWRLLNPAGDSGFWTYLGNTFFFMLGIPPAIAASLIAAILLSKDLGGGSRRVFAGLVATAVMAGSIFMLSLAGAGSGPTTLLVAGLFGTILLAGLVGRVSFYRTLFYLPNFTAGVATMLLWKKLFQPDGGPINAALSGPIRLVERVALSTPSGLWQALGWAMIACALLVVGVGAHRLRRNWSDGEVGTGAAVTSMLTLMATAGLVWTWLDPLAASVVSVACLACGAWFAARIVCSRAYQCTTWDSWGQFVLLAIGGMCLAVTLIGISVALGRLPERASVGLEPPAWLVDYYWAKPALMIMGFWGAIGSSTMLMYLAALTNVPQELYEAADIDGASRYAKFWNVTWPQLAPTTFFVVVMSVIGGLQGGFDAAQVMTNGGPAGSTTTLAYLVYQEGFGTGRLGYASAVAWTMFLLVLVMTLVTWKFGSRHVND